MQESLPTHPKPKGTPESPKQKEARASFKLRFNKLAHSTQAELQTYNTNLEDGTFDDKEGEEPGMGEKRKEAMEARISKSMDRLEKMKATLDSGEPIPETRDEIEVDYTYTNPQTNQVEWQESIKLNLEEKLQEFLTFYQETNIDLPRDFEDTIREIWERNHDEMEKAIQENGFNDILIAPANIPLPEVAEKMKMENGGYYEGNNFKKKGSFAGARSVGVDKPRIILYHKMTLPEIQKNTGFDAHLGITGEEAEKLYQQNPSHFLSTLEDLIILEAKTNHDKQGNHLSSSGDRSAVWLMGTKLPTPVSGARFVCSGWYPSYRGLGVYACVADYSLSILGCRVSRYFI